MWGDFIIYTESYAFKRTRQLTLAVYLVKQNHRPEGRWFADFNLFDKKSNLSSI